jgi:hypothetical protein
VLQFRLQVRHGDIGRKLSPKEVASENCHRHQQEDGNDADEDVGDDQAVTQAPHELPTHPAYAHQRGADSKDKDEKAGPAAQHCPVRRTEDQAQQFQDQGQSAKPQRGSPQLALGAEDPLQPGLDFSGLWKLEHHKVLELLLFGGVRRQY